MKVSSLLKNRSHTAFLVLLTISIVLVFTAPPVLVNFFELVKPGTVILHALCAGIGVGAATVTDVFFMRFLKDYKITARESRTLDSLSEIIWVALGLLIFTGVLLYLPNQEALHQSSKFLLKVVIVALLTLNGFVLNNKISPRLKDISFGDAHAHRGELHILRKLVFATGGISIVSWYTVFILGSLRSIPLPFLTLVLIYAGLLALVLLGTQVFEYLISRRKV